MKNSEIVHVVGYGWDENGISLRIRSWPNRGAVSSLKLQGKFRFRRTPERQCIGFHDFAQHVRLPCPEQAIAVKQQCNACIEREGFTVWLRSDGRLVPELKPAVRAYIEKDHVLYLACFGDATIKVGMAAEQRKFYRVWDQGPLAAYYVAKADGLTIRQLEVEVSQLGYTEFMRRGRKLELLTSGMSQTRAFSLLDTALQQIRQQLPHGYAELISTQPEPVPQPLGALAAREFRELEELKPTEQQIFEVDVMGASGSILVLDNGGIRAAMDLNELIGWVTELNPQGEVKREARQMGLF